MRAWSARRFAAAVAATLLLAPLLWACGGPGGAAVVGKISDRPVRALATVGMVADVVREVGGERVAVEALMGPGVDPHLYKPSESDVLAIGEADVVFYAGLHLEGRMIEALERSGATRPVVAVTDGMPRDLLIKSADFDGSYDPHVWMDPGLWLRTVGPVERALSELDPGSAGGYARRARAYVEKLRGLDRYARTRIGELPPRARLLVTAHDAFNYFGRAYGMEVRGLQGISTETEAGIGDVRRLADTLVERGVKAVFIETSVPRRNIEAVQAAARARGHSVRVGGELYSDAMGAAGTPEGTYIGMIRHNVDTVVAGLQ
jgi:manganese/zinc/iron transport system substrate-binding protein